MLEFGGLQHCVDTDRLDDDGFPAPGRPARPGARRLPRPPQRGRDGHGGYAPRFLRQRARLGRAQRKAKRKSRTRCAKRASCCRIDRRPEPVRRLQGRQGRRARGRHPAGRRRLPAADVRRWSCSSARSGAVALLGMLSLAVILAQVVALVLLGFAPVALIIGIFPGAGHEFFRSWLTKLATAVFIKALYSLVIAVVSPSRPRWRSATGLARVPVRVRAADALLLGDLPLPQADHRAGWSPPPPATRATTGTRAMTVVQRGADVGQRPFSALLGRPRPRPQRPAASRRARSAGEQRTPRAARQRAPRLARATITTARSCSAPAPTGTRPPRPRMTAAARRWLRRGRRGSQRARRGATRRRHRRRGTVRQRSRGREPDHRAGGEWSPAGCRRRDATRAACTTPAGAAVAAAEATPRASHEDVMRRARELRERDRDEAAVERRTGRHDRPRCGCSATGRCATATARACSRSPSR